MVQLRLSYLQYVIFSSSDDFALCCFLLAGSSLELLPDGTTPFVVLAVCDLFFIGRHLLCVILFIPVFKSAVLPSSVRCSFLSFEVLEFILELFIAVTPFSLLVSFPSSFWKSLPTDLFMMKRRFSPVVSSPSRIGRRHKSNSLESAVFEPAGIALSLPPMLPVFS